MNKNLIRGRQSEVSWHNTAKPYDSTLEVNEAVVRRRTAFLPGEILETCDRESGSAWRGNMSGDLQEVSRGHSSDLRAGGWKMPAKTTIPEDSKA
jgi:hypothetical protein